MPNACSTGSAYGPRWERAIAAKGAYDPAAASANPSRNVLGNQLSARPGGAPSSCSTPRIGSRSESVSLTSNTISAGRGMRDSLRLVA